MGSRIRDNVKHLFECFCEVVQPQPPDSKPWIIQKFPDVYKDEDTLKSVPLFAYPCEFKNTAVQHYSFVLTSVDSTWTFGFCRHDPKTGTALVLLSYLPWHEIFYKLLNILGEILQEGRETIQLTSFLGAVYTSDVPTHGRTLTVPYNRGLSNFICQCPDQYQLPSIPENRNLMEYYSAVDSNNMMTIFASMLSERRIIFTSSRLSRLSACVQAANALLNPMSWQHIFIPVLPVVFIDYLLAPMPFLVGVPTTVLKRVPESDLVDLVILDADNNTVKTPFNDLESLPADVVNLLKRQLRDRSTLLGDGVSRAFLCAMVHLIGGYRDALRFHQGERITFNSEAFVTSRPTAMQPFLRKMLQLQIFQQFIEERLHMLNSGLGFSDEFELEVGNYTGKAGRRLGQQYREWLSTMRKEGTAFFKTVRSKANPAVKSAVKTVKDGGRNVRTAYKGIRSKFRDHHAKEYPGPASSVSKLDRRGSSGRPSSAPSSAPSSTPSSPIHQRRFAPLPLPKNLLTISDSGPTATVSFRKDFGSTASTRHTTLPEVNSTTNEFSLLNESTDAGASCSPPGLTISPMEMDLMDDLRDVIFRNCLNPNYPSTSTTGPECPPVDRSLKPNRQAEQRNSDPGSAQPQPPAVLPPLRISGTSTPKVAPLVPTIADVFASPSPVSPTPSRPLLSVPNGQISTSPFPPLGPLSSPATASLPLAPHIAPPPIPNARSHKRTTQMNSSPSGDLIRLDSTASSDDFDPLSSNCIQGSGLTNPLYPYYVPNARSNVQGNTSFLYPAASDATRSPTNTDRQDSDLLREYGLDFKNLSLKYGNGVSNGLKPVVTDPFEEIERLASDSKSTKPNTQSTWTTFD